MAIERLTVHPPIEIKKIRPSQVSISLAHSLGLEELIIRGYGLDEVGASAGTRTLEEYRNSEDSSVIYIATQSGRAVGSLVTTRLTPDDDSGKKFWTDLKQKNRSLHRRLHKLSPLGINISGITTHPDVRRQGIAETMYKYFTLEDKPSFIAGLTKSPDAVIARARIFKNFGYRTFYGNAEVTPGKEDDFTNVHQNLLDAYVHAKNDSIEESEDGSGVYYLEEWLPQAIPDMSQFPDYIQKAFVDVIEAQEKTNNSGGKQRKTALKPLISVIDKIRLRAEVEQDDTDENTAQIPLFEEL